MAHVDFITLTNLFRIKKTELHLPCGLALGKSGGDRQESQSWQLPDITLNPVGVGYHLAHHLISSANSYNALSGLSCTDYPLRKPFFAKVIQICKCILASRYYDYVGIINLCRRGDIKEIHLRMLLKDIEIGEV